MTEFMRMGEVNSEEFQYANEKSERLLESLLTPTQLASWLANKQFTEHTVYGDFTYIDCNFAFIHDGKFMCVEPAKYTNTNMPQSELGDWFPVYDKIVTQLLLLRADPDEFMRRATRLTIPRVTPWEGDIE